MSFDSTHAILRLVEGNNRFTKSLTSLSSLNHIQRREQLVKKQTPFAIILSCSDSRVPSEIIFDQGLGDLFVIRIAGNIVTPSIIGSIEFAASTFGTRLVVVMGHSDCGAVSAALNVETRQNTQDIASENIRDLIERITPSIRPILKKQRSNAIEKPQDILLSECVRANIQASVAELKHGSKILESLILNDGMTIIGAEYSLLTGKVEFLTSTPETNKKKEQDVPL